MSKGEKQTDVAISLKYASVILCVRFEKILLCL